MMCKRTLEEDGKAELEEAFQLLRGVAQDNGQGSSSAEVCKVEDLRWLLTTAGHKPFSEEEIGEFLAAVGPSDEARSHSTHEGRPRVPPCGGGGIDHRCRLAHPRG